MKRADRPFCRLQSASPFGQILERLVRAVPGCHAAAFVDHEGEAVDAVGWGTEFDIKVAGAHLRILLHEVSALPLGEVRQLIVTARKTSYRVRLMQEGYAVVLIMGREAAFNVSERALTACIHALEREAGFDAPANGPLWFAVDVSPQGGGGSRPKKARGQSAWHHLEVLGAIMGLGARERGYRVRLQNGAEVTLLREPLGRWWSDELLE